MKKLKPVVAALLAAALGAALAGGAAAAGKKEKKIKIVGIVSRVQMVEADKAAGKIAEATVTILVRGKKIEILVRDELTLNKLRVKKISVDDEVRVFYRVITEQVAGKDVKTNLAATFRRTAGC